MAQTAERIGAGDGDAFASPWGELHEEKRFVQRYLDGVEYTAYDRLIQLCDSLALPSRVVLETYDPAGRLIERHDLGLREAGTNATLVPRASTAGLVFYRLKITDPESAAERATLSGKITFVK